MTKMAIYFLILSLMLLRVYNGKRIIKFRKNRISNGGHWPCIISWNRIGTPIYLTNAPFDITSSVSGSSRTYLTNGHLKNITRINETNKPTKNSLQITLSGGDQTYISIALSENIINKEV